MDLLLFDLAREYKVYQKEEMGHEALARMNSKHKAGEEWTYGARVAAKEGVVARRGEKTAHSGSEPWD